MHYEWFLPIQITKVKSDTYTYIRSKLVPDLWWKPQLKGREICDKCLFEDSLFFAYTQNMMHNLHTYLQHYNRKLAVCLELTLCTMKLDFCFLTTNALYCEGKYQLQNCCILLCASNFKIMLSKHFTQTYDRLIFNSDYIANLVWLHCKTNSIVVWKTKINFQIIVILTVIRVNVL